VIRRRAEKWASSESIGNDALGFAIASCSSRTIVYKGMLKPDQLAEYFPDLSDPRIESALALVHSRYSTNTFPRWGLAQPFHMLAHNGEINTLQGNIHWMKARESQMRSRVLGSEIKKILPLAGELGIKIGLENVWNNFLISPLEEARYIDELESPQVGAYFDVGNVLRYGWPEQWIRTLGARIIKVDIKEFSLKKMNEEGLGKGFGVELLEGDCDWPAVMAALREIGYHGWGTAEIPGGGRERLRKIAGLMDKIYAS